ncbi:MAG: hypothetical protein ACMZI0_10400 [Symbiopectobacterium sp.]|uniref:hypothetical protein n=1 Tax=Symbiopectobacterium sp. TaxID=2952789 RepID=UPI0039EB727A
MGKYRAIGFHAIQVFFKDTDTPEEYLSMCAPTITYDFLSFITLEKKECIIPASRVKHLKILPLEKYRASNKSESKHTFCTSIDSDCINNIQKELRILFNNRPVN